MSARVGLPIEHIASRQRDDVSSPYLCYCYRIDHSWSWHHLRSEEEANANNLIATKSAEAPKEKIASNTDIVMKRNKKDRSGPKWFDKILDKTKEFFEATPDQDFL
jgi:hypothetical protein